jgi:hypothetical protein
MMSRVALFVVVCSILGAGGMWIGLTAAAAVEPVVCPMPSSSFPAGATVYEYIIVGSGAGGGPLAARLAAHGYSVLLLEAGSDSEKRLNTSVPGYHGASTEDEQIAWNYFVQHYENQTQAKRDR